ncbi:MAG: hypothetical protein EBQ51_01265 [Verrucomicrobia bacterium]|nr:hypothetical protein [Verrucomicrobiota bacterium]NBS78589.1 hypothetical protein [bacterium]NBT23485.1 hypothetical protein [bacterium]NBV96251.1 hypothetical protein [Verrucomicrobiota bacterium]NBY65701.1 hypothetical protein [Verrucomicrobiota bacterium]
MSSPWTLADALRPGLLAVRKFYRVFLFFQGIALLLYFGYYHSRPLAAAIDSFAAWKASGGLPLSALLTAIAGTVLPEAVRTLVGPDRSWNRERVRRMGWNFLFFGFNGFLVDLFYLLQAFLFGVGATFQVVLPKIALDFFGFIPWVALPMSVSYFLWLELGWNPVRILRAWNWSLYRDRVLPLLLPDITYWGPILVFLYGLPLNLQVPFFLLAFSGWSLAFVFIGSFELSEKK